VEGRTPNKPFKGSLNIRITQDLHTRTARFAEEHEIKLNAMIADGSKDYLAKAS